VTPTRPEEASAIEGVEDAADRPERPVDTQLAYGRRDDLPPTSGSEKRSIAYLADSSGSLKAQLA
jgi:hypothetical protein